MDSRTTDEYSEGDNDVLYLRPNEAAQILLQSAHNVSGPERKLLDSLVHYCTHCEDDIPNSTYLKKYRLWEPVLLNTKNFEESERQKKFAHMPLGFIVDGAVEVISQKTVKTDVIFSDADDPIRIHYPTYRDAESFDIIDNLLLPGEPIGLFEAMDRSLFKEHEHNEYGLQQRNYCIFAGSRSIFPCVAFGDKKLAAAWLKDRQQLVDQVIRFLGCSQVEAEGYLIRSGVVTKKGNLSLDQFNRLLLNSVAPTPRSASILYFSDRFIESLINSDVGDVLRKLAWSRLSKLEIAQNIGNLVGHEGPESLVKKLAYSCIKVSEGEIWCLVRYSDSTNICNGTDIDLNHKEMCELSSTFGENDPPLLLVPGFLAESVEWGLYPLKQMFNELNRSASWYKDRLEPKLRNKLNEICDDVYSYYYLFNESDFETEGVPEQLRLAAQREKHGKSAAAKILYPSILIKRK